MNIQYKPTHRLHYKDSSWFFYMRTEEKKSQVCHYWFSISLFSRPKHIESDYHILGIATTYYAKKSVYVQCTVQVHHN